MTTTDDFALVRQALDLTKLEAETEKLKLEVRKLRAEAVECEQLAMIARIERKGREREEALASSDLNTHHFRAGFDEESVNECLDAIHGWHNLDKDSSWHIYLNSPGGYLVEGLHLFDDLVSYSKRGGGTHHITITARGMAASMGSILLQAADERVVGKYSHILIHQLSGGSIGSIGDMRDAMERYELWNEQIIDIYLERAEMNRKRFEHKWERKDWWLSAAEAVKLGFADRVG